MSTSSITRVSDFLSDIESVSPEQYDALVTIRQLFLDADETVEEGIKYGGLVFNLDSELIGGIFIYKQHLSIEFSNGASFSDPESLLEGAGKKRRHIKIVTLGDIAGKNSHYYIAQAVAKPSK